MVLQILESTIALDREEGPRSVTVYGHVTEERRQKESENVRLRSQADLGLID
jgi:hypothetical protein